jgi:hypothetical protein
LLTVALHDQPVAVVLDLVDPIRPIRNLGSRSWEARREGVHGGEIVGQRPTGNPDINAAAR